MTDLIDRDALIKQWESDIELMEDILFIMATGAALNDLKHQPTVDAVPVIRCKECKHYYVLNEVRGNCSEYNFVEKIPIDYCSWAERKEE